jgi:choline dehydrogenase
VTGGASPSGWDDIIVGGGSAGAVLAHRLTADPHRRVLLIEAGPDELPEPIRAVPTGQPILTGANWDYQAHLGDVDSPKMYPYRVGRVLGGSSAINGAIALRGFEADFDGWAAAGNTAWSWREVLPFVTMIESDGGTSASDAVPTGTVPIRRPAPRDIDELAAAFLRACDKLGIPATADLNADSSPAAGTVPGNLIDGRRISTAETHLRPVRHRPNLTVWANSRAVRITVRAGRAVGVETVNDHVVREVRADRVTLSAGAINTPAILLRSGIGPADTLRALGIPVVADVPGVGANLRDHPVIAIWGVARPGLSRLGGPLHQVMARINTTPGPADVAIFLANNVSVADIPIIGPVLGSQPSASIAAMLLRPESVGSVTLADASPHRSPITALRLASTESDVAGLMRGVRLSWQIARSAPMDELLTRTLIWTDRMIGDDALLSRAITNFVTPMWHPVGTARMGPPGDAYAVVDQQCRLSAVDGVRVVDASVMPTIPSAPTNLTTIMIAERAAGWYR